MEEGDEVEEVEERPKLFILKSTKAKRGPEETVEYPPRRRVGTLPHTCHFKDLKVSGRIVKEDPPKSGKVVVVYRHRKWGDVNSGTCYNVPQLNRFYMKRYLQPFPDFAINFDPDMCFCKPVKD